MAKRRRIPIYDLLEQLYFVEGGEDIVNLHFMKRKYLENWCNTSGRKIAEIIFALILYRNPQDILNQLNKKK